MKTGLSPPAVAERLGVPHEKILRWIRTGELRAYDLSQSQGGRPRWRVMPDDLRAFLARRANPSPRPVRSRQKADRLPQYFD